MLATTESPASSQSAPPPNNGAVKKSHKSTSYRDALELQRLAVRTAQDCKPNELAALMKAYESLERLKRDMRMKPNPSRVKPPVKPSKRSSAQATFEE